MINDYITSIRSSRQNKKNKQKQIVPQQLYEMFPNLDQTIIEHYYKQENCNYNNTISMLLTYQIESGIDQDTDIIEIGQDRNEQIIENVQNQENNNNISNRVDELRNEVSTIWGEEPEINQILKDCDSFLIEDINYKPEEVDYLDAIGIDKNHIPTEFVHNIQQFLLQLINEENYNFQNNFQEFPYLEENEGSISHIMNKKQYINEDLFSQQIFGNSKEKYTQKCQQQIQDNSRLLLRLCQEFPNLSYSKIKYAFDQIGTYEQVKRFLSTYYNQEYKPKDLFTQQIKNNNNNIQQEKQQQQQYTISQQYKNKSINELKQLWYDNRQKIQGLFSNKHVIQRCAGKFGVVTTGAKLNHFYNTQQQKIQAMMDEGIKIFVAIIVSEQSFTKIDLHGVYGNEIEDLLDKLIEQITVYKTRIKKSNLLIEFVVGKGLHSRNGKSVLGPIVQQYFRSNNYPIYNQGDGKIEVKI